MPDYEAMYFVMEKKLDVMIKDILLLASELRSKKRRYRLKDAALRLDNIVLAARSLTSEEVNVFLPEAVKE